MIQWQSFFFNSLWIFGMAVILASLSFQYWQARSDGLSLKEELGKPPVSNLAVVGSCICGRRPGRYEQSALGAGILVSFGVYLSGESGQRQSRKVEAVSTEESRYLQWR